MTEKKTMAVVIIVLVVAVVWLGFEAYNNSDSSESQKPADPAPETLNIHVDEEGKVSGGMTFQGQVDPEQLRNRLFGDVLNRLSEEQQVPPVQELPVQEEVPVQELPAQEEEVPVWREREVPQAQPVPQQAQPVPQQAQPVPQQVQPRTVPRRIVYYHYYPYPQSRR